MFHTLLKSKFYSKSKSAIKLTKTRIEMIKRKRNAMQKYLKNDISDLLKHGLDTNAYGRVEGLCNELNLSSCYDSVEKFCVHISSHLTNMDKQRECPEECREAVASLTFAAARFADLPELRELRKVFTERYGNSIDCYANKEFVNKLKATPPTKDVKLQLMQDIASESGIEWNSKALEQKLYNLPAPVQERAKEEKNDERILKTMDDGAEKILNKGTRHKHEHPKGSTDPEKKIEDLPYRGRKEQTGDESNLPTKREKVVVEGKQRRTFLYEKSDDSNSIKHVAVDRCNRNEQENEPQTLWSTSGEEDDEKPFYYKPFRPPYTKSKMSNADSSLMVPPIGMNTEVTDRTETPDHIDRDHVCQRDANGQVKPVPKSVRRRFLKPQEGIDQESEKQGRQPGKASDHDPRGEEERKLDWLLSHYSNRKPSSNGAKLEPVAIKRSPPQAAADNTNRDMEDTGKDGPPPRTASLPNEPSSAETLSKGHARAASFHVHPKLPDYDHFVARLAAFRGEMKRQSS